MKVFNSIFRLYAYIRHLLFAYNTGGEGVHSPYLYSLIDNVIDDTSNSYYVWQDIELCRVALLLSTKSIYVEDYGTGVSGTRRLSAIARTSLKPARQAQLLFRLVNFLFHEKGAPLYIVELGTSLGLTTAYLAAVDRRNRVVTYEGSSTIADVAKQQWRILGLDNITCIEGNIDDTLFNSARVKENDKVDFIFLDANHSYEATLRYFEQLLSVVGEKTMMVIDDIHSSPDMDRAWWRIKHHEWVTSSFDLFDFGILFFDEHYLRRHYRLRY